MKKVLFVIGLVAFAMTMGMIPESIEAFLGLGSIGSVMANMPLWVTMKGEVKGFKTLTQKEEDALSDEDLGLYKTAKFEDLEGRLTILVNEKSEANANEIKELHAEKDLARDESNKALKSAMIKQSEAITKLQEDGTSDKKNDLRKYIEENSQVLAKIKANKNHDDGSFAIELKGSQAASDITSGSDYAEFVPGTVREPVRNTSIMDIFRRKPVSTEYIKYREENVVTRDAKFVVACATSTHTTKKSWITRTVELAKIRDIIDICIDMLEDYDFVESEIKELIEESVKLKADRELLLGVGVATTDMLSLETISSEFNPANALADFSLATGTPFQDANLEQLVDAMSAQISVFGELNAWMADTLIMNFKDFVNYRNLKDANGNKLVHTLSDAVPTIAGLKVVVSPIVVADTCYVFDSTKGSILDRQALTIKTSFENNDNIEHETVTLVAVERLQFHVPLIQRDAFMKCSGVAAAIVLITAP